MKNFKKVLALVLVLATLLGLATMASATEYKDADKIAADYDEAVKVLDLIETMQGYPDGNFKPTATITREEAAKVIAIFDNKDADISTYYTSINPFTDEKGRWGESYVGYGYRAGIIAGMNAAFDVLGKPNVVFERSQALLGVLTDDLTRGGYRTDLTREPFRMFTSRCEYRLTVRAVGMGEWCEGQDNADLRLTEWGHAQGVVGEERYAKFMEKKEEMLKVCAWSWHEV